MTIKCFSMLVLLGLIVGGCDSPPEKKQNFAADQKRGEARIALFRECMTLATQMPRQFDDDVARIVNACSEQAYYMTNFIGWTSPPRADGDVE